MAANPKATWARCGIDNMKSAKSKQQREVDRNYKAFMKQLSSLMITNPGEFALMKGKKIVAFFNTGRDAHTAAYLLFEDRTFSIQEVRNTPETVFMP